MRSGLLIDRPVSYSARELQSAAAALAAGHFTTSPVHTARPATGELGLGPLVRVRATHSGAGASTVALALADAADAVGTATRVLDAAAPEWSGLVGATATELGTDRGWRHGRRGHHIGIDRVADSITSPAEVPIPRQVDGVRLTILDVGWLQRELPQAGWVATARADVEVLVTRSPVLALSQTEAALADLASQGISEPFVVVVGATKWSNREFAAAGRLLRQTQERDAVLFMPLLPAKALPGLGPDPLPKQLINPASQLLTRIQPS